MLDTRSNRSRIALSRSLLFGAAAAVSTGAAFGQTTGSLGGTVTDASGAVIAGAQVVATQVETGQKRQAVSSSAGVYSIPSLQPGTYSVMVTSAGMQSTTVTGITLSVDTTQQVNVKLGVSGAEQTVDVTATSSMINTSTMTVGQVIDQKTVQEIPLNGRHFLDLAMLSPGSVIAPPGGLLTTPNVGLGASSFLTSGNREDTVNFMINGINLNDMIQNTITFQPSINTVSEFKVNNSSLSAEYGRNSGAVVTVATRSGTNTYHGEAFDFIRNNDVDARNFFNPKGVLMSPLHRNQPGGALGGPLRIPKVYDGRDKSFFFISYEGLYQSLGAPVNSFVLNNNDRNYYLDPGGSGAHLPLDPVSKAIVALIPVANDSTGTRYVGSTASPVFVKQLTGDLLQTLTEKDTLHFYYAWQQDTRIEPTQSSTIPGFGDHRDAHRHVGTLSETHVFSSNVVNEFRIGGNRRAISFNPRATYNPTAYGINAGVNTPIDIPQITITSLSLTFGGPSAFPQGAFDTTLVGADNVNWLKGKHNINIGGEYRYFINDNLSNDSGTFVFPTVLAFQQDQANTFSLTPGPTRSRILVNASGVYVEDVYKMTQKLTLQAGARFDWYGSPVEQRGNFTNLDLTNPAAVMFYHQNKAPYNQSYNVGPRFGFIYDTRGNGSTILRGGYSLQADQPETGVVTGLATNPPYSNRTSFAASKAVPYVSMSNALAAAQGSAIAPAYVNPDYRAAYVESYNLNLQQQLPFGLTSQLGYIGSRGIHLHLSRNDNQPNITTGARPYTAIAATSPYDAGFSLAGSNITEQVNQGMSAYNALWLTVTKQLAKGLEFNSSYTWSKSMDDNSYSSQGVTFQDSYNLRNNYGQSDFDVRSRFVFSGLYTLPFHQNRAVEGWQISSITQIQTGNPLTVVTSSTINGTSGTVRPDMLGPVTPKLTYIAGAVQYLPASLCLTPVAGCIFSSDGKHFGNEHRGAISGPGFQDVSVSVDKKTKIYGRVMLDIKVDAFNVLNHPNFGVPSLNTGVTQNSTTISAPSFGQISSTRFPSGDVGSSRQMQLSGKIIF